MNYDELISPLIAHTLSTLALRDQRRYQSKRRAELGWWKTFHLHASLWELHSQLSSQSDWASKNISIGCVMRWKTISNITYTSIHNQKTCNMYGLHLCLHSLMSCIWLPSSPCHHLLGLSYKILIFPHKSKSPNQKSVKMESRSVLQKHGKKHRASPTVALQRWEQFNIQHLFFHSFLISYDAST